MSYSLMINSGLLVAYKMLEDVGSCWKMLEASAPELCSAKKEMSPNAERFALSWQDIMP